MEAHNNLEAMYNRAVGKPWRGDQSSSAGIEYFDPNQHILWSGWQRPVVRRKMVVRSAVAAAQ